MSTEYFVKMIEALKEQCETNGEYQAGAVANCVWMQPFKDAWDGNTSDVENLIAAFSDDKLESEFVKSYNQGEAVGKKASMSLQINYLHMMGRAFRSRHMNPARASIVMASRLYGHAEGLHTDLVKYVQDMIPE